MKLIPASYLPGGSYARCRHCGQTFATGDACIVDSMELLWIAYHEECIDKLMRSRASRLELEARELGQLIENRSIDQWDSLVRIRDCDEVVKALVVDLSKAVTALEEARRLQREAWPQPKVQSPRRRTRGGR